jgi:hypothetical protein
VGVRDKEDERMKWWESERARKKELEGEVERDRETWREKQR